MDGRVIQSPRYVNAVIMDIKGLKVMFSYLPIEENDIKRDEKFSPAISRFFEIFIEHNCDINVHGRGHSHSMDGSACCRNVSVEVMGFKPVRIGGNSHRKTHQDKK